VKYAFKRKIIKLMRATTLQLLHGGMTGVALARPSQTKRTQSKNASSKQRVDLSELVREPLPPSFQRM
jgi:hypothetical protein